MPYSLRSCPRTGCAFVLVKGERFCPDHQREHEQQRGSPDRRGYDKTHRGTRAALLPHAYGTTCQLCGLLMTPAQALDLDHSDPLRRNPNALGDRIVHAGCNRARRD